MRISTWRSLILPLLSTSLLVSGQLFSTVEDGSGKVYTYYLSNGETVDVPQTPLSRSSEGPNEGDFNVNSIASLFRDDDQPPTVENVSPSTPQQQIQIQSQSSEVSRDIETSLSHRRASIGHHNANQFVVSPQQSGAGPQRVELQVGGGGPLQPRDRDPLSFASIIAPGMPEQPTRQMMMRPSPPQVYHVQAPQGPRPFSPFPVRHSPPPPSQAPMDQSASGSGGSLSSMYQGPSGPQAQDSSPIPSFGNLAEILDSATTQLRTAFSTPLAPHQGHGVGAVGEGISSLLGSLSSSLDDSVSSGSESWKRGWGSGGPSVTHIRHPPTYSGDDPFGPHHHHHHGPKPFNPHSVVKYLTDSLHGWASPHKHHHHHHKDVRFFSTLGKAADGTLGGVWAARRALRKGAGTILSSKVRFGGTLAYVGSEVLAKAIDIAAHV